MKHALENYISFQTQLSFHHTKDLDAKITVEWILAAAPPIQTKAQEWSKLSKLGATLGIVVREDQLPRYPSQTF